MVRVNAHFGAGGSAWLLCAAMLVPGSPAWSTEPDPAEEIEALIRAEVAPLTPDEALDERHVGQRVRWAGGVYSVDGRCLTINFARTGDYGEPRWTPEPTYQSFVACGAGPYDPELVHDYTNVTIIGVVTGKQYIGMGGGGSDGPSIEIERLYRWSDCLAGDDSPVCKTGFLTADPIADR
jgi:hypothetical protein